MSEHPHESHIFATRFGISSAFHAPRSTQRIERMKSSFKRTLKGGLASQTFEGVFASPCLKLTVVLDFSMTMRILYYCFSFIRCAFFSLQSTSTRIDMVRKRSGIYILLRGTFKRTDARGPWGEASGKTLTPNYHLPMP